MLCWCGCASACVKLHTYAHAHTHTHTHRESHTHARTHTGMHTHTRTHTHTHTRHTHATPSPRECTDAEMQTYTSKCMCKHITYTNVTTPARSSAQNCIQWRGAALQNSGCVTSYFPRCVPIQIGYCLPVAPYFCNPHNLIFLLTCTPSLVFFPAAP